MASIENITTAGRVLKSIAAIQKPPITESNSTWRRSAFIGSAERRPTHKASTGHR